MIKALGNAVDVRQSYFIGLTIMAWLKLVEDQRC